MIITIIIIIIVVIVVIIIPPPQSNFNRLQPPTWQIGGISEGDFLGFLDSGHVFGVVIGASAWGPAWGHLGL